jgi:uncharacterized protein DUF6152
MPKAPSSNGRIWSQTDCSIGGIAMKHKLVAIFALTIGLLIVSVPLFAHHGAASFDTTKKLTLKGTVVEWFWANPHCFLRFSVKDEGGQPVEWVVETQSGPNIVPLGYTKQTFKPGDEVTVTLEPVRNGKPLGRLLTVVLPSGKKLGAMGENSGTLSKSDEPKY